MIRLAADLRQAVEAGLCPEKMGVFALKQLAQLDIYGQTPGVFELWLQLPSKDLSSRLPRTGDAIAAVSRFSGVLTVSCLPESSAQQLEELRLFIEQLGGSKLEGTENLLQRLGVMGDALLPFGGSWIMCKPAMSLQAIDEVALEDKKLLFGPAQSLTEVYALLCRADARFAAQVRYDAWLVDFSHRCRHQKSECYILKGDKNTISTISILYLWNGQAVAGSIATDPAWQNKGYARRVLAELCRMTARRGQTVRLLAADDCLAEFYERCGWEKQTRWASRGLSPL